MNLSVGIVGLPNVGKSTLFNALLKKQAAFVANYPFATIEPNIGVVPVPDERLKKLAEAVALEETAGPVRSFPPASAPSSLASSNEVRAVGIPSSSATRLPPIVPATVNFVDIAGLVKGASEGAGLGNKFLSHIREVSIIAHVIRAFEDPNIIREGSIGPKEDYEAIETELILADLSTISKIKDQKSPPKADQPVAEKTRKEVAEKLWSALNQGIPAREVQLAPEEIEVSKTFFLLSRKPELIVLNVSESDCSESKFAKIHSRYTSISSVDKMVIVCAKIESDLSELSEEEQKEYLKGLGLKESGLERLIKKAYETLGLISFLTAPSFAKASEGQGGKWEVRAWTIEKGTTALGAAGVIHTDFTKNFIKAEVVSFEDFINPVGLASPKPSEGGWKKARELGKTRFTGRDYIMQDGDVVEFKIGT